MFDSKLDLPSPAMGISPPREASAGALAWFGLAVLVILYDLLNYWIHRVQHMVPFLWRIHRIHHADRYLDFSSALRFHPLEFVFRFMVQAVAVILVGLSPDVIAIYQVWVVFALIFSHANIAVPKAMEGLLGLVFVLPNFHRIHHSTRREQHDSNYGIGVMTWDHMFRSFTSTSKVEKFVMGLPGYVQQETVSSILSDPFKSS